MRNKNKTIFAAFVCITALFLSACSSDVKEKTEPAAAPGTVRLSIANGTARTISPATGVSYKNVSDWKITFKDMTDTRKEKYDDIVKTVSFSESDTQECQLPLGTFDVYFEGTATNEVAIAIPYYGKSTVTVEEGKTASVSVFVSPKKLNNDSENADGTFSYNLTVSTKETIDAELNFSASLIPLAEGAENIALECSTPETTEDAYTFTITNSTEEEIPSGFYNLSVKVSYTYNDTTITQEIFLYYYDCVVEIIDGLETTGSKEITINIGNSKTYYATTGDGEGSGLFAAYPKNVDKVLEVVQEQELSSVTICMVDNIYPSIDVSKINEKTEYNFIINGKCSYTIKNDSSCTITVMEDNAELKLIDSTVTEETVTEETVTGKTATLKMNSTDISQVNLTLNNNVSIAYTYILGCKPNFILKNSDDGYKSVPFITITSSDEKPSVSVNIDETLETDYKIFTKTARESETGYTIQYFLSPTNAASQGISGIESFTLSATDDTGATIESGSEVTTDGSCIITISPVIDEGEGIDSSLMSYNWYFNKEKVSDSASYIINFSENEMIEVDSQNSVVCIAQYNGEYASAEFSFTPVQKTVTAVLYNNTSDTIAARLSYATFTGNTITTIDTTASEIIDFCFDASNNLYAIVGGSTINKYSNYDSDTVTTYTLPTDYDSYSIDNIEALDDGTLYALLTTDASAQAIAKLTLAEDEMTITQCTMPNDWDASTYPIMTFCTNGADTLYIVTYTTETDSTAVKLASYTVADNVLTVGNSITLASTTEETCPLNSYGDAIDYKDLCYINGTLYLLVNDVVLTTETDTILTSRGALCTFTVSDSGITTDTIGIGYQTTEGSFTYTSEDPETVERKTCFGDGSSTFYGPVKFIARKEDELIIADEGYSVEKDDTNNSGEVSSKNAVAIFDLSKKTLSFASLEDEYFDKKYSGTFFGSSPKVTTE